MEDTVSILFFSCARTVSSTYVLLTLIISNLCLVFEASAADLVGGMRLEVCVCVSTVSCPTHKVSSPLTCDNRILLGVFPRILLGRANLN